MLQWYITKNDYYDKNFLADTIAAIIKLFSKISYRARPELVEGFLRVLEGYP
jgi:hypothetical protein